MTDKAKKELRLDGNDYIENRRIADCYKQKWNHQVDTILQRGDRYVIPDKPIQRSTLNYFERMREKEIMIQNRPVHTTISKAFQETKPNPNELLCKKKTYAHEYKNRTTVPKKEKQIRVYPDLLKSNDKIRALLTIQDKSCETEANPRTTRIKANGNNMTPSNELKRMNTKKQLMPCEQGEYATHRYQRGYSNTKARLFNTDINPNQPNTTSNQQAHSFRSSSSTPRIKLVHKIELKDKTDHINSLISYQFGPKFKEEKYTDKPNRSNYRSMVQKNIDNINENYITQVY